MKLFSLGTTATQTAQTPFATGWNAVAVNQSASPITITQCDTLAGTYTSYATVPANGMAELVGLPAFLKASAAINCIE